jgi:hypothetical protein
MNTEQLSKRRAELEARADQEKLDWRDRIKNLRDDHLVVLALATILRFNLKGAFNPAISITDLERQRKEVEAMNRYREALRHASM